MFTRRKTPLHISAVSLLALSVGACSPSADHPSTGSTDVKRKAPPGLILKLSAEPEQPRDEISVELTVINRAGRPIGWDSEFAACLSIEVKGSGGDQGRLLPDEEVIPQNPDPDRFITLREGEQLTKEFTITKPMRVLIGGMGSGGPNGAVLFGEEVGSFYSIPEDWESIQVWARYSYSSYSADAMFLKYYGMLPDDVKVFRPDRPVASNTVQIRMR